MSGSWKVAYADFVTAMMAFFLLMWILTMVPPEKREAMAVYFMDPGGYNSQATMLDFSRPPSSSTDEADLSPAEMNYLAIQRFLDDLLQDQLTKDQSKLNVSESGVLLRTSNALNFAHNAVDLGPEGMDLLKAAVEVMRRFKVHLVVSGHTDSSETGLPRLRDKWELAAARAAAATAFIVERGGIDPSMIMSTSYANFRPIVPDSVDEPDAINRRVEFFFYTPDMRPANLGF
ncbi:MAG: flagellar motor protein MotB [Desulfovibrio sp.]|jgi:chemotaxis protein MotB|nr:flagellar motor protein MotB [Desulfovibrio sp.]